MDSVRGNKTKYEENQRKIYRKQGLNLEVMSKISYLQESTEHPKSSTLESANERRTTQSEPPFSVAGSISTSNPGKAIYFRLTCTICLLNVIV